MDKNVLNGKKNQGGIKSRTKGDWLKVDVDYTNCLPTGLVSMKEYALLLPASGRHPFPLAGRRAYASRT